MATPRDWQGNKTKKILWATAVITAVAACTPDAIKPGKGGPYAPGVDRSKEAVDGVQVANRLMEAQQFELALDAFNRAALEEGLTPEILTGMAAANIGLGRLGQAQMLLEDAVKEAPDLPEAWNNLGVLLMEKGETLEAVNVFRKAYALDNGENDAIRDNLRLALAKSENPDNTDIQNEDYKLVRRGSSQYAIRKTP